MGYYTRVENEGTTATDIGESQINVEQNKKVSKEHIQYYFNLVKAHKWQDWIVGYGCIHRWYNSEEKQSRGQQIPFSRESGEYSWQETYNMFLKLFSNTLCLYLEVGYTTVCFKLYHIH